MILIAVLALNPEKNRVQAPFWKSILTLVLTIQHWSANNGIRMSANVKQMMTVAFAMNVLTTNVFSKKATLSAKMNVVIQKRIFVAEKLVVQRDKIVVTESAVVKMKCAEITDVNPKIVLVLKV